MDLNGSSTFETAISHRLGSAGQPLCRGTSLCMALTRAVFIWRHIRVQCGLAFGRTLASTRHQRLMRGNQVATSCCLLAPVKCASRGCAVWGILEKSPLTTCCSPRPGQHKRTKPASMETTIQRSTRVLLLPRTLARTWGRIVPGFLITAVVFSAAPPRGMLSFCATAVH